MEEPAVPRKVPLDVTNVIEGECLFEQNLLLCPLHCFEGLPRSNWIQRTLYGLQVTVWILR
jgi:hypothetical protein